VLQEGAQLVSIDVRDEQLIYLLTCSGSSEHHQQANSIAIAVLSVASQISFPDEVFHQEAPDPRSKGRSIVHGFPHVHSLGSGDWPQTATPESSSGNTGSSAGRHVRDRWTALAEGPARSRQSDTIPSVCGRRTCAASREAAADENLRHCDELPQGCTGGGSLRLS